MEEALTVVDLCLSRIKWRLSSSARHRLHTGWRPFHAHNLAPVSSSTDFMILLFDLAAPLRFGSFSTARSECLRSQSSGFSQGEGRGIF